MDAIPLWVAAARLEERGGNVAKARALLEQVQRLGVHTWFAEELGGWVQRSRWPQQDGRHAASAHVPLHRAPHHALLHPFGTGPPQEP